MKPLLVVSLLTLICLISSCKKEDSNLSNFSGTTWKGEYPISLPDGTNTVGVYLLKFTGKTTVELYEGNLLGKGSYSIDGVNLTMTWTYNINFVTYGNISGSKITVNDLFGDKVDFIKQ